MPANNQLVYLTNCTRSTYEKISHMTENSRLIRRKTFESWVSKDSLKKLEESLGYDASFKMRNDAYVTYHASTYNGKKCVYSEIFGGATVMTVEQLAAVNGYSNMYWGWGGEDDDLSSRIRLAAGRKTRTCPSF